jgi:hypothetical protein
MPKQGILSVFTAALTLTAMAACPLQVNAGQDVISSATANSASGKPSSTFNHSVRVTAKLASAAVGVNTLWILITDANHNAIPGVNISLGVNMATMDMGETHPVVTDFGSGRYRADVTFSMDGPWRITLRGVLPRTDRVVTGSFDFTILPPNLAVHQAKSSLTVVQQAKADKELLSLWKNKLGAPDPGTGAKATTQQVLTAFKHGANINARDEHGLTSLMMAASSGNLSCIKLLISKGADVNATEFSGWTPLHWASDSDKLDCVKYLVDNGASVNAKNFVGGSALLYAAEESDFDCANFLLSRGADVNCKDNDGMTPLIESAYLGNLLCVRLFISHGAIIDAVDSHGWTALMQAASAGKADCVKYLIAQGANQDVKSTDGDTALSAAAAYPDIINLLKGGAH